MPAGLEDLNWELPHTFLGLDEAAGDFENASAVIFPVPYESTTSYGGGTRQGPGSIIDASRYIELYDQEFDCEAREGRLVMWPAYFTHMHRGIVSKTSTKYIVTGWIIWDGVRMD